MPEKHSKRDIIVIGASAGGIEACAELFKNVPKNLPATIFVVVHVAPSSPSVLPRVLGRNLEMTVKNPSDGEHPRHGVIYVAPANHHLILRPDLIRLGRGPRENGYRPSIDALFRTAAFSYRDRVIGIVLSGALNDGTAGLLAVKAHGGLAIVQDPEDAMFEGMPSSALEFVDIDYVLPAKDIGLKLSDLLSAYSESNGNGEQPDAKTAVYEQGSAGLRDGMEGVQSHLTCPSCGGTLWEVTSTGIKEFNCHVGHSFTAETLLQEQADSIDTTFWRALRSLEENIALRRKLLQWAHAKNKANEVKAQEEHISLAEKRAANIRSALLTDVARLSDPGPSLN